MNRSRGHEEIKETIDQRPPSSDRFELDARHGKVGNADYYVWLAKSSQKATLYIFPDDIDRDRVRSMHKKIFSQLRVVGYDVALLKVRIKEMVPHNSIMFSFSFDRFSFHKVAKETFPISRYEHRVNLQSSLPFLSLSLS